MKHVAKIVFCFRYSILRLKYATEVLLSRHGSSIIDKHIDLERLARCVIDIYVATAVLGMYLKKIKTSLKIDDTSSLHFVVASIFLLKQIILNLSI